MRFLVAIAFLLGTAPTLANPPGADYCMSKFNLCMTNAAGPTQAGYCRANMELCLKKPPANRGADEQTRPRSPAAIWTTTVKPR
jgi:hypothetical protein